eukprot:12522675-Ditylum_brightwellii.AAC.1
MEAVEVMPIEAIVSCKCKKEGKQKMPVQNVSDEILDAFLLAHRMHTENLEIYSTSHKDGLLRSGPSSTLLYACAVPLVAFSSKMGGYHN